MTINVNDVDEFDVGAITDSDATANAVDENAAVGHGRSPSTALASDATPRTTRSPTRWMITMAAGSRLTVQHRRGHGGRRRDRSRSRRRQPQHHGSRDQRDGIVSPIK